MTAPVVRRLRLPAAQTSPATARAAVHEAIVEVDLIPILDEALLLTTELVTNGVIHARTDLEIEIIATVHAISVMVLDRHRGPLSLSGWDASRPGPGTPTGPGQLRERGRGLLLVDRFASRWGTLHHAEGKGVWFRLDRPASLPTLHPATQPGLAGTPGVLVNGSDGPGGLVMFPQHEPGAAMTAERFALLAENYRLRRIDAERRAWLTFLAEAGELLAQSLDVELTLALIPRLLVPRLGPWCAVHTVATDETLRLAAATHADESQLHVLIGRLESSARQLRELLRPEGVAALGPPIDGYAVPLIARGQLLGAMTVGRGTSAWQHPDEVAVIEDVARRAALAIDNARIHADLRDVAIELQRSLLPPQLPTVAGIEFGAQYVPARAGVDVGGDFYDVVALPSDGWLVVIGDVSGKGIQVAAMTGLVRDVTRVLVRDGRSLPEALALLNETLVDRGEGRFCTVAFAALTRATAGVVEVSLYLAGHDQPIHVLADGTTTLVGQYGTALGLFGTVRSPEFRVQLRRGETLVLYTDGVTERRRGDELFGQERLRTQAGALAGFPAEAVAARLLSATLGFSREPPVDDIAILVVRNDGLPCDTADYEPEPVSV